MSERELAEDTELCQDKEQSRHLFSAMKTAQLEAVAMDLGLAEGDQKHR